MSQLQENLLGAEQLHEASDAAQPSYAQPAHFSHLQPSQPAAAHALPNIAYRLDAAHQQQQQQQHHLAPQYASQPPQPQHAYVHYAPEQQSHVRYPFSPQYAPAQAGIPVFPSAPAYPAPHAPFSPYASDLVRVERRQTHFSLHRDRVYATTYPVFMNSSLVLYLSADEWAASVDAINASLLWPRREKVVNAGALGVVALVVLLNLVVPASSSSWGLPLRWILVAGAFIAYMTVLRRLKARVNAQADAALRTESAKYETANPAERQGRLPCMLRWDGEHNVNTRTRTHSGCSSAQPIVADHRCLCAARCSADHQRSRRSRAAANADAFPSAVWHGRLRPDGRHAAAAAAASAASAVHGGF